MIDFEHNIILKRLNESNLEKVYNFCEANVDRWSQPLHFFRLATLEDTQFNADLTLVAEDDKENILAFFMGTTRKGKPFLQATNFLKMFVVSRKYRRKGLGAWMLKQLYKKFIEKGRKGKISVFSSVPDFWFSGINPKFTAAYFWLKKMNFKRHKNPWERFHQDLYVDFDDPNIPVNLNIEPLKEKGNFKFERISEPYYQKTYDFAKKHHGMGTWPEEIQLSLRNDPTTTFIAIDKTNDEVVGWATHSAHFDGSFGPTAVLKDLRGRGIGGILFQWTLYDLKQTGHKRCQILWVVGDTVKYYSKVAGAYIGEIYYPMSAKIKL